MDPVASIALSLDSSSASVVQGGSFPLVASVTRTGGPTAVTLSVEAAPVGVSTSVGSTSASGETTTTTITIEVGGVRTGTYALTVRARAAGLADATAGFTLIVTPFGTYTMTVSPSALTIGQGGTAATSVGLARSRFSEAVTLSLEGLPSGMTGYFVFNPVQYSMGSGLHVTTGAAVAPAVYDLTVRGVTPLLLDQTAPLTVTVVPPPTGFTLSLSPAALSVERGQSAVTTVSITRTNYAGHVTLSAGVPASMVATFDPVVTTTSSSTLTIHSGTAAQGSYSLSVAGSGVGVPGQLVVLPFTVR